MFWSRAQLKRSFRVTAGFVASAMVFASLQGAVVGVSATLLPVLVSVDHLNFGTVFPGEKLTEHYTVMLASEFQGQTLPYSVGMKRKPLPSTHPEYPNGGDPGKPGYYRDLCPFLTLTGEAGEGDVVSAAMLTAVTDVKDVWDVLLNAPAIANPISGGVSQGHDGGIITTNGEFGCDLTININPACGNGMVEEGEQCDDANTNDTDACHNDCTTNTTPVCGNGMVEEGEQCDLGPQNGQPGSTCTVQCTPVVSCTTPIDVVFIFDRSGSMNYDNGNRLADAKAAAKGFTDLLKPEKDQEALVTFSSTVATVHTLNNDFLTIKAKIDAITASGATNIGDAIKAATAELNSVRSRPTAAHVEILLTDGKANKPNGPGYGEFPADVQYALLQGSSAAAKGYKIFTIGLGTDVNTAMLQQIATSTNGKYYFSPTSSDLGDIYTRIAGELCPEQPRCGDGKVNQTSEQCDDGNTNDLDTCHNNCTINAPRTYCGDAVRQTPNSDGFNEQCDDGNVNNGDACRNDCTLNIVTPVCGNGIVEQGEQCDLGSNNGQPGAICNAICESVESCSKPVDVMLVFDRSGSMNYDAGQRLADAKAAAKTLVGRLSPVDKAGLVSYASQVRVDQTLNDNFATLQGKIDALVASGATNIGDAIKSANQELGSTRARLAAAHVEILLTDGRANKPYGPGYGEDPRDVQYAINQATAAAAKGYKIFTIGLGTDVNTTMLQQIASTTGGLFYFSPNSTDLDAIYRHIAVNICPDPRCGDGKVNQTIEQCDAGIANGNACTPNYENSCNYCSVTCQPVTVPAPYCGDTITNGPEKCDDGNTVDTDSCRNDCTLNPITLGPPGGPPGGDDNGIGTSGPSGPVLFCGDDIINQPSEQCDAGDHNGIYCVAGYGKWCVYCSAACKNMVAVGPRCGDFIKNGPEQCDGQDGVHGEQTCSSCMIIEPVGPEPTPIPTPTPTPEPTPTPTPSAENNTGSSGNSGSPTLTPTPTPQENTGAGSMALFSNSGGDSTGASGGGGPSATANAGQAGSGSSSGGGSFGSYRPQPILSLSKTANVLSVRPGETITYTIIVRNSGGSVGNGLVLKDVLPKGFHFVDSGRREKIWEFGAIGSFGGAITIVYDVAIATSVLPGSYENTVLADINNGQAPGNHAGTSLKIDVVSGQVLGAQTNENGSLKNDMADDSNPGNQPGNFGYNNGASGGDGQVLGASTGTPEVTPFELMNNGTTSTSSATSTSNGFGSGLTLLWLLMLLVVGGGLVVAIYWRIIR